MSDHSLKLSRRDFLKLSGVASLGLYSLIQREFGIPPVIAEELLKIGKIKSYWVPSTCIICGQGCPIKIQVLEYNGKRILHQIKHNYYPGFKKYYSACGRPRALYDVWRHPDRIRKPMIRVGSRGSGEFREASWSEALDLAANKLRNYLDHPEQIILFSHQGCEKGIVSGFAKLLGTPNVTKHADTCHTSADVGRWFVFGKRLGPGAIYPDYEHAQFVVFMNRNPYGGFVATPWAESLSNGLMNGLRIVVFDVRFSDVCGYAEKYFVVRPGSDLAISLSILNYILGNEYFDSVFLRRFTNASMLIYLDSFEPVGTKEIVDGVRKGKLDYLVYDEESGEIRFKSEASAPSLLYSGSYNGRRVATALAIVRDAVSKYSFEWASKISGVDASEIKWVAQELVNMAPRAFIDHGYKAVRYYNEAMLHRVNALINVLLGSVGVKGGWAWPRKVKPPSPFKAHPKNVISIASYWMENGYPLANPKAYSLLAIKSILEEKPYPIKVAIISNENLLSHLPGTYKVVEALNKLDFILLMDVMWNETCLYADVILPTPFFFEYDNASIYGASKGNIGQVGIMRKAVDPPNDVDVKPPREIIYELVKRLMPDKLGDIEIIMDPEAVWRVQCEKLGIDYNELIKYGTVVKYDSPDYSPLTHKGVLNTKTGEIEIINLDSLDKFKDYLGSPHYMNPLPIWVPPLWMQRGGLGKDEFIPVDYMNRLTAVNTWARNTHLLQKLIQYEHEDVVLINKYRARELGISDGDIVELYNPETGMSIKSRVLLSELVAREVICGVHGLNPGPFEKGMVRFTYMAKYGINTNHIAPFHINEIIGSASLHDFVVKVRRVGV